MQLKLVNKPTLFMKGLPTLHVVFDDQQSVANERTFVIRKSFKFVDIEKLIAIINHRSQESVKGMVIDLRKIKKKRNIHFIISTLTRKCWYFGKYQTRAKSRLIHMEQTIYIWSNSLNDELDKSIDAGNLARELASEPSNMMGGTNGFCDRISKLFSKRRQVHVSVLDASTMAEQGLGLIVGMGGASNPKLLIIDYTPKQFDHDKHGVVCLVGKGVCFDTGGYALKDMKNQYGENIDKTGAAIVVGAIKYACDTANHNRIIAIIPLIENKISDVAVVPGDVLKAFNGLTVEIVNPDAEGRVIVADAVAYASEEYNPDLLLDFGTFTGWGNHQHCGTSYMYFTLNSLLDNVLQDLGEVTGERGIRLPPWPEYIEHVYGSTADLVNVSRTCVGEGNIAALFLLNFVSERLRRNGWIHFDVVNQNPQGHPETSYCNGLATCIELLKRFKLQNL